MGLSCIEMWMKPFSSLSAIATVVNPCVGSLSILRLFNHSSILRPQRYVSSFSTGLTTISMMPPLLSEAITDYKPSVVMNSTRSIHQRLWRESFSNQSSIKQLVSDSTKHQFHSVASFRNVSDLSSPLVRRSLSSSSISYSKALYPGNGVSSDINNPCCANFSPNGDQTISSSHVPTSSVAGVNNTDLCVNTSDAAQASECQKIIKFVLKDQSVKEVQASVGDNLLEISHHNNIDVEGACEASLACSTCHVILDPQSFKSLPEASEREEDLLDLAPQLSDTSRLACQVRITKELDGMEVTLPMSTLNFYVDGHQPTSH